MPFLELLINSTFGLTMFYAPDSSGAVFNSTQSISAWARIIMGLLSLLYSMWFLLAQASVLRINPQYYFGTSYRLPWSMFTFKLIYMTSSVFVLSICWTATLSGGSGTISDAVRAAGMANVVTLVFKTLMMVLNLYDPLYTTRPACGNEGKPELGGVEMSAAPTSA